MPDSYFEFLVEEPSMEAFLKASLPNILPKNCIYEIYSHEGKEALLRKLENRLKGYYSYIKHMPINYRIVVIVDRDRDDCKELKSRLEQICNDAGLRSRQAVGSTDWQIVTRIAIEELEAWYFGDWQAVQQAYPKVPQHIVNQARYRDPDAITGGTWEAFERVLKKHGYFKQGLNKVQAATAIGKYIDPARNRSRSFASFHAAITEAST